MHALTAVVFTSGRRPWVAAVNTQVHSSFVKKFKSIKWLQPNRPTHTPAQCRPANVGLAQAHPNYVEDWSHWAPSTYAALEYCSLYMYQNMNPLASYSTLYNKKAHQTLFTKCTSTCFTVTVDVYSKMHKSSE